ncbi:MAG: hypothetical protein H6554_03900 [Chitinophagales bacterium]|nr:hypothetical protein [Chitinophagales bacterium]
MKNIFRIIVCTTFIFVLSNLNTKAQTSNPCSGTSPVAPFLTGSPTGFCNTVNLPETLTQTTPATAPDPTDTFCEDAGWAPTNDVDGCNDGWFRYIVPPSGLFNLDITNSDFFINFALYSGNCSTTPFVQDICLNDGPIGYHALYTYDIYGYTPGDTIFIRAWDYNCNQGRVVDLCITEYIALNDPCNDPAPALTANVADSGNTSGTSTSLTEYPIPSCGNYVFNCEDTWFQFTAPSDGSVTFDITRTGGTASGSSLSYEVYDGACPDLIPIACDDFHDAGTPNELNFVMDAGDTYYIRVWDYNCDGNVQFTINPVFISYVIETACDAPTITAGTTAGQSTGGSVSNFSSPGCGAFGVGDTLICEDAWFKYIVPAGGGNIDVDLANVAGGGGSSMGTALYYQTEGSVNGSCEDLTLMSCDALHDDANDGVSATNLIGGTILYLRVWDYDCDPFTKTFDVIINFTPAGTGSQTIAMNAQTNGSTVVVNCGSTITITDSNVNNCSGTHPTGQSNCYDNNEDYTITLVPSDPNQQLMIIETGPDGLLGGIAILQPGENSSNETVLSGNDYLYLHDGTSTSDNIVTVITGEGGSAPKVGTYVSSNDGLTLHFISGETGVATGFVFQVTCTTPPTTNTTVVAQNDTIPFSDTGGCTGNYTNNQHYIQTFCPDAAALAAGEVVQVDMGTINLTSERRDLLYVFDGPDINSPLIGKFGGETNPLGILRASPDSPTGCLTFLFVSDGSVVDAGWCANVFTAPPILPNGSSNCVNALDISSPGVYQSNSFLSIGEPFITDPVLEIGGVSPDFCDPTNTATSRITQLESTVWYKFVVPPISCGSEPLVDVQIANISSIYINSDGTTGAQFVLYETDGCVAPDQWDNYRVYCADKLENGDNINIPPLSPGEVYYVMVDAFGGRQTNFDIIVNVAPLITDLYSGTTGNIDVDICTNSNDPSTASDVFDLTAEVNTEVEFISIEAPATLADGDAVYNAVDGVGGVISLGTAPLPVIPDGETTAPTTLSDATLPANETCEAKTYNIYVRATETPAAADCRPYQEMQVTVYPRPPLMAPAGCSVVATADCAAVDGDASNITIEYSANGSTGWNTDPNAIHPLPLTNGEQIFYRAYVTATPQTLIDNACVASGSYTVADCVDVGDFVFIDLNNDGIFNGSDLPMAGVTVELYNADTDAPITEYAGANAQVTNATGNYLFTGVPAGDYYVVFTTPSGYQVSGTVPTGDNNNNITGANGTGSTNDFTISSVTPTSNLTLDASFTGTGSIGDYVWEDTNGDGMQNDGATGIDGVTLQLTWYGPDGAAGGGDDVIYPTQQTSGGGNYDFGNLPPGNYVVDVLSGEPAGSSLTGGTDPTGTIALGNGQDYNDADFGYQPPTGSIGDFVFIDLNNDGIYNGSDLPMSGVTATLYDATTDTATSYTDVTDASGNYLFTGVPAGDYYVVFTTPSGYQVSGTVPTGNNNNNITGANGAGSTNDFSFDGLSDNLTIDASFTGTGSIGDYVWEDTNGDGMQNDGATGIDGVTLQLTWYGPDGAAGGGDDVIYPTQQTSGGGNYDFGNLPPGNYVVDVLSGEPAGSSLTGGTDPTGTIALGNGQDYNDADFGYQPPTGSIGDFVFIDLNNDGIYNGSDLPLSGVTATLYDATTDTATSYTDVTDASGNYLFTGVPAGDYYVVFTTPSGYQVSGTVPTGNNNNNITGANGAGSTNDFSFDGTTSNLSMNASFTGTGSIGSYVWEDTDGDGTQNEVGTGIDGVEIQLTWYGPDGEYGRDVWVWRRSK